jgi:hypothetical protein
MSFAEPLDPLRRVVKIERLVSKIYFCFSQLFLVFVRDGERGRAYILRALEQAGQDRKEAAKLLDVSLPRFTVRSKT